jgi:alpha-beta hydrolase superfamily lysophospholipase
MLARGVLFAALLALGCVQAAAPGPTPTPTPSPAATPSPTVFATLAASPAPHATGPEEVSFVTRDGVSIRGTYHPPTNPGPYAVVLLHMLGRNRTDWNGFVPYLQREGFAVLAFDLRGHGESAARNGQPYEWRSFSDADFRGSVVDVEAAKEFLRSRGHAGPYGMVGASIGANLAIRYAAQDTDVRAIVALSPGLDYRGVDIEGYLPVLGNRPLYVALAERDEPAAAAIWAIRSANNPGLQERVVPGIAHGTGLLTAYSDFNDIIPAWLHKSVIGPAG